MVRAESQYEYRIRAFFVDQSEADVNKMAVDGWKVHTLHFTTQLTGLLQVVVLFERLVSRDLREARG